jgi:hypothetical protein
MTILGWPHYNIEMGDLTRGFNLLEPSSLPKQTEKRTTFHTRAHKKENLTPTIFKPTKQKLLNLERIKLSVKSVD